MKLILASTPLKVRKLLKKLDANEGPVGFDTEVVGPLLKGRDFVNISYSALLGLSVAFEDEECYYLPFRHKGNNASFMDLHEVCTRLQTLAKQRRLWAHNAKFDHQVMIRAGYPMVGMLDSMVAAWLVGGQNKGIGLKDLAASLLGRESPPYDPTIGTKPAAEVLEYACHDALNTLQLGLHYQRQGDWFAGKTGAPCIWFLEECDFAMLLAEMKLQGICLDRKQLALLREEAGADAAQLLKAWEYKAPMIPTEVLDDWDDVVSATYHQVKIGSTKDLQYLFTSGEWSPRKKTATGISTGKECVQWQVKNAPTERGRELARIRLQYQEVIKIVNTYTDGLIEEALQWSDKRIHPDLHQFGTVTGRLASAHPNIQNQPAHGKWAALVRECFVPDPGMEFTSADYSQVELRYFADYCGGNLLQAFLDGKDLHEVTGNMLGVERSKGKTVNFGFLLYGGGPRKLAGLLDCTEEEAKEKIALLHKGYPEVEGWRNKVIDAVRMREPTPWCKTRAGRIRYIPELNPWIWRDYDLEGYQAAAKAIAKKYGFAVTARDYNGELRVDKALYSKGTRLVINYLVQGGSRDLLVIGMNSLRKELPEYWSIVTTVHDEVMIQHPEGRGHVARGRLKYHLEGAGETLGLKVPMLASPKTGRHWGEVK